jgi:hypothetical protein
MLTIPLALLLGWNGENIDLMRPILLFLLLMTKILVGVGGIQLFLMIVFVNTQRFVSLGLPKLL